MGHQRNQENRREERDKVVIQLRKKGAESATAKGRRKRDGDGGDERGISGGVRREHIIPGGSVSFQAFNVFN